MEIPVYVGTYLQNGVVEWDAELILRPFGSVDILRREVVVEQTRLQARNIIG